MIIDAYAHLIPPAYLEFVEAGGGHHWVRTWSRHSALSQPTGQRIELLDEFGVGLQIVTPPVPPVDHIGAAIGEDPAELAARLNDGIAAWCADGAGRFRGVGAISLHDPAQALRELDRAVNDLGLVGVQVPCGHTFRPLDAPELEDVYTLAESLDATVWIHPWRDPRGGDYPGEDESRRQVSYLVGWPYETTVAVFRMASSGVLSRHPALRFVLHHAGGVTAPLWQRLEMFYSAEWSSVTGHEYLDEGSLFDSLRAFYVDTATSGSTAWLAAAVEFFGLDHVVFGTDAPFGAGGGRDALKRAADAVEGLGLGAADREKVLAGNAGALLPSRERR